MALDQYHHGVRVIEVNEGIRPIRTIATAVIGLVATGPTADATIFPLNTPVRLSDVATAIGKAGTTGTLPAALEAINKQGRALVIVVRVEPGADEAETTSKVIGTTTPAGKKTGLQALLSAEAITGSRPRILGVPGLDNQAVATELASIAKKLNAFAYASAWECDTIEDATAYRGNFGARELMIIHPDFRAWSTVANATVNAPAVAYALGLRAQLDLEIGWHKTISNMAVQGVTGISRDIYWELQSSDTEAGILNEADVTTLISRDGFRFWGNRSCSDDPLFAFESTTRTAQVLRDTIAEAHMWAVDKPFSPGLMKDIINGCNDKFRGLKTSGYILGAEAWFNEQVNTTTSLKQGRGVISYNYTDVKPLEDLVFQQQITDEYLIDFAKQVNQ